MAPSRNVDSWKKRHLADSESSQLYAEPVPEATSFRAQDLNDEDAKLDFLQLDKDPTWDVTAFDKISVVTPGMGKAPDVKFDVQFPTSFNFSEDIFITDNSDIKDAERASTPIPMTPDSNRSCSSLDLEMEDPPVVSTERTSDAESHTSDIFDDVFVDDPNGNKTLTTTSDSSIKGDSNLKDMAESVPDVVYSSSDSEEESVEEDEIQTNKGHASIQSAHHRKQPKGPSFISLFSWKKKEQHTDPLIDVIDAEFSDSPVEVFQKKMPPKDDEDCDDMEDNDSDEESSDEDDIVTSPERKKTMYYAIRRRRSRDNEDANFFEDFAEEFFTCSYFFKCLGECAIEEGCSNGKEVADEDFDTTFVDGESNDDKPVMEVEEKAPFDEKDQKKNDEGSEKPASAPTAAYRLAWIPKLGGKAS